MGRVVEMTAAKLLARANRTSTSEVAEYQMPQPLSDFVSNLRGVAFARTAFDMLIFRTQLSVHDFQESGPASACTCGLGYQRASCCAFVMVVIVCIGLATGGK